MIWWVQSVTYLLRAVAKLDVLISHIAGGDIRLNFRPSHPAGIIDVAEGGLGSS